MYEPRNKSIHSELIGNIENDLLICRIFLNIKKLHFKKKVHSQNTVTKGHCFLNFIQK